MSTNDVPGANPQNADVLAMGCWAEAPAPDGSLIFVESMENGRVIYSIFDTSRDPIVEYRDAMPEDDFKKQFSWKPSNKAGKKDANIKWIWHDKTAFPWDRVIKHGAQDGPRFVSAQDQLTAAQRVAESLHLRAATFQAGEHTHKQERTLRKVGALAKKLSKAMEKLDAR